MQIEDTYRSPGLNHQKRRPGKEGKKLCSEIIKDKLQLDVTLKSERQGHISAEDGLLSAPVKK